jgi:hypothetical protein
MGNGTNDTLSLMGILDIVDKSIDIFKKIFSSSKKSEIIANFTQMGFDRLEAKSTLIMHKGIPELKL